MKDKIDINLRIADIVLSLSVNPEEERLLREAAKSINEAWSLWRSRFKNKSQTEVLAMVTLLFTKGFLSLKEQEQRTEEVLESVEHTLDMLLLEEESSGMNES